ncbi:MAG: hypothetical protein AMXMBFR64_45210 [Myxococcales bacterium]
MWAESLVVAVGILMLATSGCGERREETPQRAYEEFFGVSSALVREPQEALQEALWERLAPESRDALEERTALLNASLPEGARLAPHRLLIGRDTPAGSRIQRVEVLEQTEREATLRVVLDAGEATVRMLRDADRWTVALPPLPPS